MLANSSSMASCYRYKVCPRFRVRSGWRTICTLPHHRSREICGKRGHSCESRNDAAAPYVRRISSNKSGSLYVGVALSLSQDSPVTVSPGLGYEYTTSSHEVVVPWVLIPNLRNGKTLCEHPFNTTFYPTPHACLECPLRRWDARSPVQLSSYISTSLALRLKYSSEIALFESADVCCTGGLTRKLSLKRICIPCNTFRWGCT